MGTNFQFGDGFMVSEHTKKQRLATINDFCQASYVFMIPYIQTLLNKKIMGFLCI